MSAITPAAGRSPARSNVNHIFATAGLRDRTQAVAYAYRTGIAAP